MSRFTYCPHCSTPLVERAVDHRRRHACPQCSFIDWRNAKPCAGVLVMQDGKVLLVKRAIEPFKGCWDIPGGFMEAHETPEQAATREMLEETGLTIGDLRYFIALPDTYGPTPPDGQEPDFTLNIYFTAKMTGGTLSPADDAEEARWFALNELPTDDQIAFVHARSVIRMLKERAASGL